MIQTDIFVGVVAVALGAFGLGSSIFNWEWSFQLTKMRWIESKSGRRTARCYYALVGALLIVLGLAIAVGFSPNSSVGIRPLNIKRNGMAARSGWFGLTARCC